MAAEHEGLLADPHTWVLFSAILFAAVGWVKGRKPLLSMLDTRTARIKSELDEASRLRKEAEALLTDYQNKQREAVVTAQKIIDNAQNTAAQIQVEAEKKLTENLHRREELLMERIQRAEGAAVQELRQQAADIAAAAAEKLLAENISRQSSRLVEESIAELPKRLSA